MPQEIWVKQTVYNFADLAAMSDGMGGGDDLDENVEMIRRSHIQFMSGWDWYDYEYTTWQSALAQIGFDNVQIQFSGFSSQGDGASFTASLDLEKLLAFMESEVAPSACISVIPGTHPAQEEFGPWIVEQAKLKLPLWKPGRGHLKRWISEVTGRVKRDGYCRDVYPESCDVELDWSNYSRNSRDRMEAVLEEFKEAVQSLYIDLAHAIYRGLEAEWDYRCSDEAISEDLEANEQWFDENGERVEIPPQPVERDAAPPAKPKVPRDRHRRARPRPTRELVEVWDVEEARLAS